MKKSSIVICFFLAIIVAEIGVLIHNFSHSQSNAFSLDEQTYEITERQADIPPFPFEYGFAERIGKIAEILEREATDDPLQTIVAVEPNKVEQVSETTADKPIAADDAETKKENVSDRDITMREEMPATAISENAVKIAIVIDDVGLSDPFVKELAKLKKPITASFLTYGAAGIKQAQLLKDSGLEVMLHVPMMPHVPADLAPITLSPEMDKAETQAELEKMIARYNGVKLTGVNNHMGSLLTEKINHMRYVMEVLKKHGMFFLDSKTTSRSVAKSAAAEYGVPYIARDVFLDNKNEYDYILEQMRQAERIAQKRGYAVVIGHPHSQTLKVLQSWLQDNEQRGFKLVHISDLLK